MLAWWLVARIGVAVCGVSVGGAALAEGRPAAPPPAFADFCRQFARECAPRGAVPGALELTQKQWRQLRAVNSRVNRAVREVSDQELYGRPDVWTLPRGAGDCEDVALQKRHELMAMGWPSSALLMAVARNRAGEGHAVLLVPAREGFYVLDSLTSTIRRVGRAPYVFYTRQSQSNPRAWVQMERSGMIEMVAAQ